MTDHEDHMYVGYLPLPARHRRFVRIFVPAVLVIMLILSGVIATMQSNPGDGLWTLDNPGTWRGFVSTHPYPTLTVAGDDGVRSYLLVGPAKSGVRDEATPFDGQWVDVSATELKRDGRYMLSLVARDAFLPVEGNPPSALTRTLRSLGAMTLEGEIIDPKCYLGAMRPGGGKTHRSCAILCLRGGIPPMFVTSDSNDVETYYLLVDESGAPILDPLLEFVGEAVEMTGEVEQDADVLILRVDPAAIRRK